MDFGPNAITVSPEYLEAIRNQFLNQIVQLNQDRDEMVAELKDRISEQAKDLSFERQIVENLQRDTRDKSALINDLQD